MYKSLCWSKSMRLIRTVNGSITEATDDLKLGLSLIRSRWFSGKRSPWWTSTRELPRGIEILEQRSPGSIACVSCRQRALQAIEWSRKRSHRRGLSLCYSEYKGLTNLCPAPYIVSPEKRSGDLVCICRPIYLSCPFRQD